LDLHTYLWLIFYRLFADFTPENAKEINQETIFNQHLLVCALQEQAALFINLGTSMNHLVTDQGLGLLDGIFGVLIHPSQSTRLSAAWALRCLCVAIPTMAYKCIERCLQALDNMKVSPEAVSGYSTALAAILGGVRHMPLGIPHATGKVFIYSFMYVIYYLTVIVPTYLSLVIYYIDCV
jgi:hypothetical protein